MPLQTAVSTPKAALAARDPELQFGAYAVIEDGDGKVLTVEAENGRCYLPGGRIEEGETPREALIREIGEECAWSAAVLSPLRQSTQSIMGGAVRLRTSHWRARLVAPIASTPEHRLVWMTPQAALDCLHRECDRDALQAAVRTTGRRAKAKASVPTG